MDFFFDLSFVPLTAILNLNDEQLGSSFIVQNIQASLDWKRHALYANVLRYFDIQTKMASCTSCRRSLDLSCVQLPARTDKSYQMAITNLPSLLL